MTTRRFSAAFAALPTTATTATTAAAIAADTTATTAATAVTLATPAATSTAARRKGVAAAWIAASLAGLAACGGGDNPLGNPSTIANPGATSGEKLSYVYYQKCINPIVVNPLTIGQGGITANTTTNTCAASGCHGDATGVGGAFRLVAGATQADVTSTYPPETVRASAMWKNFYSAQASTVIGSPAQSNLLKKPLVQGVLHGGGLIFANAQDPNVLRLQYWISRPVPAGQDEFSVSAANAMFTPADAQTGACNSL